MNIRNSCSWKQRIIIQSETIFVICTDHHNRKLHKIVNRSENKRQRREINWFHYPKTPTKHKLLSLQNHPSITVGSCIFVVGSCIVECHLMNRFWELHLKKKKQDSIASKKTYIIKNMLKVMRNKNTHHLNRSCPLSFRIWRNFNIVHNHVFFISQRTRRYYKKQSRTLTEIHKLRWLTKTIDKKKENKLVTSIR